MKHITSALILCLFLPIIASARTVATWPYDKLFAEADLVAVVELRSISDSKEELAGHGDVNRYLAKVAHLTVGMVFKGEPGKRTIDLLHFVYAADVVSINGALFLDFSDAKKHQYLVFLKRGEGESFLPVGGQYDAEFSVKKIRKDYFSPIDPNRQTAAGTAKPDEISAPPVQLQEATHLATAFLAQQKVDTSRHYVGSATIQSDKDGKKFWQVKWVPIQRVAKGDWFMVKVGMDRTMSQSHGE